MAKPLLLPLFPAAEIEEMQDRYDSSGLASLNCPCCEVIYQKVADFVACLRRHGYSQCDALYIAEAQRLRRMRKQGVRGPGKKPRKG